jgi:hypothetical protein
VIVALATLSWGAVPVVSASGGYDVSLDQPWAGVELAVHASHDHGVEPVGRLVPAYGFFDHLPFAVLEAGALVRVPEDEAVLRTGVVLRPVFALSDARLPWQFGDPADGRKLGILPGLLAIVEFEWNPEAPLTIGFRGGPASSVSDYLCETADSTECLTWHVGFAGGFYARKRLANGFALEAIVGTTSSLSIGWTL